MITVQTGNIHLFSVTICGYADDHCPALTATVRKLHWPLSDPARAEGDEDQVMSEFRACCDDIRQRVRQLLEGL